MGKGGAWVDTNLCLHPSELQPPACFHFISHELRMIFSRISNFQPTEDRELGVLDLGDERSWLSLAPEKSIDRPPAREHTAIVYDAEERVSQVQIEAKRF